jgi:hypothetical protein
MIKAVVALCFCSMYPALSGQAKLQTFTSPDGVLQFMHSKILVRCAAEKGSWTPAEACSSQGGPCDDVSSSGTVVCFAYPRDGFTRKPAFGGAAFFVAEISQATA